MRGLNRVDLAFGIWLLVALLLVAAIAKAADTLNVPLRCISKIRFTKSCHSTDDNTMVCDGVTVILPMTALSTPNPVTLLS